MKLSKLYSNRPYLFNPIVFNDGLNVCLAEIRLPENKEKDTHNLGKTTLGRLLDFLLLARANQNIFLLKHHNIFKDFVFFLEIKISNNKYVTIRRSVEAASKISFMKHTRGRQDFSAYHNDKWDHYDIGFEKAKEILDGLLDYRNIKPWTYRQPLGYLLRTQEDFRDVFQLRKHQSKHKDWKPFLAQILGFDSELVISKYQIEEEYQRKKEIFNNIKNELGLTILDISKIEGMILLKCKDAEKKEAEIKSFDFRFQDKEQTKDLVNNLDSRISKINERRYSLLKNINKIEQSLSQDQILFNPEEAKSIFNEAGILFEGQIKKDFQQLIEFNKTITEERWSYLKEELQDLKDELRSINIELDKLGKKRSSMLSFLKESDFFNKYRQASDELVKLQADIIVLERQRDSLHHLQTLRNELRTIEKEKNNIIMQLEENVENQTTNRLFTNIRITLNDIVESVIDRKALLSVDKNKEDNLEFKVEILNESGDSTSADKGSTYKKLLCVAFDLAVLYAHIEDNYPRFVFHDGVFESLDDRKKEKLKSVLDQFESYGLQIIITLIDSDIPKNKEATNFFDKQKIILRLHDEDNQGRLFKMDSW